MKKSASESIAIMLALAAASGLELPSALGAPDKIPTKRGWDRSEGHDCDNHSHHWCKNKKASATCDCWCHSKR